MINTAEKILSMMQQGYTLHKHYEGKIVQFALSLDNQCGYDVDTEVARSVTRDQNNRFMVSVDAENNTISYFYMEIAK